MSVGLRSNQFADKFDTMAEWLRRQTRIHQWDGLDLLDARDLLGSPAQVQILLVSVSFWSFSFFARELLQQYIYLVS